MNKNGPIIIIEDDADDQFFLARIFKKLNYKNEIVFFFDGEQAEQYIRREEILPFLILSDIKMPKLDGFTLRSQLKNNDSVKLRTVPYIFFSTALTHKIVVDAYAVSAQGVFVKESSLQELEKTITVIMEYWSRCASPHNLP